MTDPVRDPDAIEPEVATTDPAAAATDATATIDATATAATATIDATTTIDATAPETTIAEPLSPAATPDPDAATPDPATATATSAASPYKSRRLHLLAGIRWLVARAFAIALFLGGVAIGYGAYLAVQPPPIVAVDPAVDGTVAPAVVQEFIAALASNDSAALRSAVDADPYQLLIAEMSRWDIQSVESVETLSTYVDGPRTATQLIVNGKSTADTPVSINLIVHVDTGQIASFR